MPGPVSCTAILKCPLIALTRISTEPVSVNLIALPTMLSNTCVSRRSSPRPIARSGAPTRRHYRLHLDVLGARQRAGRSDHRVDDCTHRVFVERQFELPGIDLRDIQHVVDQAQKMLAVLLDEIENLQRLVWQLAVESVD